MSQGAWTIEIDDAWIAWLVFDAPGARVNTFTSASLAELSARLDELAADERIKAVAIRSAKTDSFVVGADIDELAAIETVDDARAKARAGLAVFDKIAALPVPTVAVIHGACMGGGLEMALACDWRLATDHPKTTIGLPETKLGIIPGWGGTQRMPRVIGLAAALGLILAGRALVGRKALRRGLVDGLLAEPFLAEQTRRFVDRVLTRGGSRAVLRVRRLRQPRAMRLLEATGAGRAFICRSARRDVLKKTGGAYPAPLEALDVMRRTAHGRLRPEGFELETEAFARLACGSVSRHLVWLFQASQRNRKGAGAASAATPSASADRSAVVGAGIMGGGIAWALSNAGLSVRLKDIDWNACAKGLAAASRMYGSLVKRRKISSADMHMAMHRISPTLEYTGFRSLDVVVEAVAEDLAIKQRVLRDIEQAVDADTVICTNTSSLPLRDLSGVLKNPKRFVGLHFFNPVNRMQLVEVVPCRRTSKETVVRAAELVRRMGKLPIVVGDCPGFLVNRILLPYLVESAWMFEEGVGVVRLDTVLERFGMPMGPLALADEVGLDVGYKVAKVLEDAYGSRMHVAGVLGTVTESRELLGKKTGRGFYVYGKGARKPNPDLGAFVERARQQDGVRETALSDDEIVDRAILIMVNEAARCLDEGVAESPEQLDLALVMGTGFAPFRGGLLRYADERGVSRVRDRLDELAVLFGDRFEPVPLIRKIAGNGNRFYGTSRN